MKNLQVQHYTGYISFLSSKEKEKKYVLFMQKFLFGILVGFAYCKVPNQAHLSTRTSRKYRKYSERRQGYNYNFKDAVTSSYKVAGRTRNFKRARK